MSKLDVMGWLILALIIVAFYVLVALFAFDSRPGFTDGLMDKQGNWAHPPNPPKRI